MVSWSIIGWSANGQVVLLNGMGATPCQFLGVSNPVFQRRSGPGVAVKISKYIFNSVISCQLLPLRSSKSSIMIAHASMCQDGGFPLALFIIDCQQLFEESRLLTWLCKSRAVLAYSVFHGDHTSTCAFGFFSALCSRYCQRSLLRPFNREGLPCTSCTDCIVVRSIITPWSKCHGTYA